jgi:hypothetical protein
VSVLSLKFESLWDRLLRFLFCFSIRLS